MWYLGLRARSPPHPMSPAVSILPGGPGEPDLVLEEVGSDWEEDGLQGGGPGPQGSAAAPAGDAENEAVEQMPR